MGVKFTVHHVIGTGQEKESAGVGRTGNNNNNGPVLYLNEGSLNHKKHVQYMNKCCFLYFEDSSSHDI